MFKNYLRSNGVLRQFIDKELRAYSHEDLGYLSAFLAKQHQGHLPEAIYEELNVLETNEHWEIAKGNHLEQLFRKVITRLAKLSLCPYPLDLADREFKTGSPLQNISPSGP